MKELVGRLTALDPEARETLAVITYFDTLMDGSVSVETLLRGAATLSGVAAGYRRDDTVLRIRADGHRDESAPGGAGEFPSHVVGGDALVWIERETLAHANDAMILERLAIAITIASGARTEESSLRRAVEVLLGESADEQRRLAAAVRLQIAPTSTVRAIALPADAQAPGDTPTATLATPWGIVRGEISTGPFAPTAAEDLDLLAGTSSRSTAVGGIRRQGVGVSGGVSALHSSWRTAVVALQFTDEQHPIIHADHLGTLLHLTDLVAPPSELSPDVAVIGRIATTSWTPAALRALADGLSVRAVASSAGLHHSTVRAKLPELTRMLGYDPLTSLGRTRLYAALLLWRLAGEPVESRDTSK